MTADVTAILGGTDLFGTLSAPDLAAVATASRLRKFHRGHFAAAHRNAALRGFERAAGLMCGAAR
jgi:hypothetical protein